MDALRRNSAPAIQHGYGATGLHEIWHAAGAPKGSFYHHFRQQGGIHRRGA